MINYFTIFRTRLIVSIKYLISYLLNQSSSSQVVQGCVNKAATGPFTQSKLLLFSLSSTTSFFQLAFCCSQLSCIWHAPFSVAISHPGNVFSGNIVLAFLEHMPDPSPLPYNVQNNCLPVMTSLWCCCWTRPLAILYLNSQTFSVSL